MGQPMLPPVAGEAEALSEVTSFFDRFEFWPVDLREGELALKQVLENVDCDPALALIAIGRLMAANQIALRHDGLIPFFSYPNEDEEAHVEHHPV